MLFFSVAGSPGRGHADYREPGGNQCYGEEKRDDHAAGRNHSELRQTAVFRGKEGEKGKA